MTHHPPDHPHAPPPHHAVPADPADQALGFPVDRAGAMLPANLLQDGETIILLLKPSPLYILLGSLPHLAAIVVIIALCWAFHIPGVGEREAILLGASLIGVRLVWQFLEWLSRIYVLTDRRVIRIMGVLRVYVFEAQLKKIQHTQTVFTIRERLFGLGTIGFATAGTAIVEAYWVMLHRPLAVHRKIVQTMNRYK
ncbi:MAG: PH domain-containing protein [Phycisphaerales bacterium]